MKSGPVLSLRPVPIISPSSRAQYGADERSRTANLRITSALLYQLSYVSMEVSLPVPVCNVADDCCQQKAYRQEGIYSRRSRDVVRRFTVILILGAHRTGASTSARRRRWRGAPTR